jgi:hypothetical protein
MNEASAHGSNGLVKYASAASVRAGFRVRPSGLCAQEDQWDRARLLVVAERVGELEAVETGHMFSP